MRTASSQQPIQFIQTPPIKFPKNESSISQSISHDMAPILLKASCLGFLTGTTVSIITGGSYPILSGVVMAALTIGVGAIVTKGMQTVADASVDAAVFVVKLPFRAAYYTVTGLYSGGTLLAQKVYGCFSSSVRPQTAG